MSLRFDYYDLSYLNEIGFSKEYLNILTKIDDIACAVNILEGNLNIRVVGPWKYATLYETPILAIVNELYGSIISNSLLPSSQMSAITEKLSRKVEELKKDKRIRFIEFGTRRRFSKFAQKVVMMSLQELCPTQMIGTSNVLLARDFDITPLGTLAHEVPMFYACISDSEEELFNSQGKILYKWISYCPNTYYIPDTYGTLNWLKQYAHIIKKNESVGLRQDSGNPITFIDLVVETFEIESCPKLMFSDGLNIATMQEIMTYATNLGISSDKICFGWGTNLTNDGVIKPLSIVMKLNTVKLDYWRETVKLSDNIKKAIGRPLLAHYCKVFNYDNQPKYSMDCTY